MAYENRDEFFLVLRDLLAELKDGHVYYKTKGGGEVYPYYPPRHFKDRHAYSPFVVRKYFDRELKLTESSSVEYEILPGNIGYAFLSDFHKTYLIDEFPGVLEYLKNTKGLILDIRQKRGGDYQNIEAVITRFLTGPLERNDAYTYGEKWVLPPFQPSGPFQYTNPVVVLINGSTLILPVEVQLAAVMRVFIFCQAENRFILVLLIYDVTMDSLGNGLAFLRISVLSRQKQISLREEINNWSLQ